MNPYYMSRQELEKEFKRLALKAYRRKEVFRRRGIISPVLRRMEVVLENQFGVNPYSRGVKFLSKRQLIQSIGFYEKTLKKKTSMYTQWREVEKRRLESYGFDPSIVDVEVARRGVERGLSILESHAAEYDYDSHKYRQFFIDRYKKGDHFNLSEVEYRVNEYITHQTITGQPIYEDDIEQIFMDGMRS